MPFLADAAITWVRRILPRRLSRGTAIGIGAFWFLLGALARLPFQDLIGLDQLPFLSFFPMLLFAGLMGGGTGGLACLLFAALWTAIVILPPSFGFVLSDPNPAAKLALFLVSGGLVTYTSALLRNVILKLDDAKAESERWAQSRDQLARELEHRIKNLFGIVLGIAHRTARGDAAKADLTIFEQRILALAGAQSLLAAERWSGARLADVIKAVLAPFVETFPGQIQLALGPVLTIREQSAVSLALALHELATNAMKYGALSVKTGQVSLALVHDRATRRLALRWEEQGGPACAPPDRTSFGTELIKSAFAEEAEPVVTLNYGPGGLVCEMAYRLSDMDSTAVAVSAPAARPHLQAE